MSPLAIHSASVGITPASWWGNSVSRLCILESDPETIQICLTPVLLYISFIPAI
jgi:hypothetical protein